jgi:hypothetical protein
VTTVPPSSTPDDPLAHAEAAFLRVPVPDGPAPEVVARTLAALTAKTENCLRPSPPSHRVVRPAASACSGACGSSPKAMPSP